MNRSSQQKTVKGNAGASERRTSRPLSRHAESGKAERGERRERAGRGFSRQRSDTRQVPNGTAAHQEPVSRVVSGSPLHTPLFVPQDAFSRSILEKLPQALDQVMPLSRAHRAGLSDAIQELSALLTFERSGLGRSYWSAPRLVSAYLRYFLPWNLVRLSQLLPGLKLPDPSLPREDGSLPSIVDLGSGPLTLPIALWIARPDWRNVPLEVICVDTVPRPMELGRQLLESLASLSGERLLWKIRLVRSPLLRSFRELKSHPLLIMAGNVLNERKDRTGHLEDQMGELATLLQYALDPAGMALFVEPGTRLGGTLTATLREMAIEEGMTPLAPCPHAGPCPISKQGHRRWCHVTLEADGPAWLAGLARQAGLPKSSLSLSFMLLGGADVEPVRHPFPERGKQDIAARILSEAFPVPGMGLARYACSEDGFSILPVAGEIPSGALVACRRPDNFLKDDKSGALVLHWRPRSQKQ